MQTSVSESILGTGSHCGVSGGHSTPQASTALLGSTFLAGQIFEFTEFIQGYLQEYSKQAFWQQRKLRNGFVTPDGKPVQFELHHSHPPFSLCRHHD